MRTPVIVMLLYVSAWLVFQSASAQSVNGAESQYNSLHATERATFKLREQDQIKAITQRYEEVFPRFTPAGLRKAEAQSLHWLFKSAYLAAFYSRGERYLNDLRLTLFEMERREAATAEHHTLFYGALVGYRELDEARAFLSRHPTLDVEPTPAIDRVAALKGGQVPVYGVDRYQHKLHEQGLDISSGTHLVVVAHPLCSFSRSAMQAVEMHRDIVATLDGNVVWLAPVDLQLHFAQLQEWNRAHPEVIVVLARRRQDWPMIKSWSTPQFYLIRDGDVIDHFSGWPRDGSGRARLVQMLTSSGGR